MSDKREIAVVSPTPATMLQAAIERGIQHQELEGLLALHERWEANEARKAFVVAMNAFKANPPRIVKDKAVAFSGTAYRHATLATVCDAIVQGLSEHGLSHRWEVEQNGIIKVTCVITHERGHSERVSMSAPADDSGKKNVIQQIASTVTYLERYTLMAATGLAAKDMDTDGITQKEVEYISDEQLAQLEEYLPEGVREPFMTWLSNKGRGPQSLAEIPAEHFDRVLAAAKKAHGQRAAG